MLSSSWRPEHSILSSGGTSALDSPSLIDDKMMNKAKERVYLTYTSQSLFIAEGSQRKNSSRE